MRMTDRVPGPNNRRFACEVLASWIVTLFVLAVGILLLGLDKGGPSDRVVLRWHDRPAAGEEERDEEQSATCGPDWVVPQSGSSSAPDPPANQQPR
jgi:hypothetical protein